MLVDTATECWPCTANRLYTSLVVVGDIQTVRNDTDGSNELRSRHGLYSSR